MDRASQAYPRPGRRPGACGMTASRPARRQHRVFRPRAARAGMPVGPGAVLDALEAVRDRRRRHPRGFLLDAARGVREAARAYHAVRPGLPICSSAAAATLDKLLAAMLPQAADRARRSSRKPGAQRVAGGAVRRRRTSSEQKAAGSRDRRAADGLRPRGAAEEGFRADDARPKSPPPRRRSASWCCRSTRSRRGGWRRAGTATVIDLRRTLRASMKAGGAIIDLQLSRAAQTSRRRSWRCSIFPAR